MYLISVSLMFEISVLQKTFNESELNFDLNFTVGTRKVSFISIVPSLSLISEIICTTEKNHYAVKPQCNTKPISQRISSRKNQNQVPTLRVVETEFSLSPGIRFCIGRFPLCGREYREFCASKCVRVLADRIAVFFQKNYAYVQPYLH